MGVKYNNHIPSLRRNTNLIQTRRHRSDICHWLVGTISNLNYKFIRSNHNETGTITQVDIINVGGIPTLTWCIIVHLTSASWDHRRSAIDVADSILVFSLVYMLKSTQLPYGEGTSSSSVSVVVLGVGKSGSTLMCLALWTVVQIRSINFITIMKCVQLF